MTTNFGAIDLSKLAAPDIVEALDYETIFGLMLADLQVRLPDFDVTLDSEPAVILLQVAAYREFLLRQRVNDAARAVMVAYAEDADLDQLGALFGVERLTITPEDTVNHIPAVMESNDDFRARIVLSPESYSVAGPEGAYIFFARSADGDVRDAAVASPSPGEVVVTILSRTGTGAAPSGLVTAVGDYLSAATRRPLTDHVTVQSAAIVNYSIVATITTFEGPDASTVLTASQAGAAKYVADSIAIGRDITRAGLFAAIVVPGVQNASLTSPAADVVINETQAGYCTGIAITYAGVGE